MNHKGQSTENTEYTERGFCRLDVGGPFRLIRGSLSTSFVAIV